MKIESCKLKIPAKAYTLVELLVVISIISIMTVAGVVSLSGTKNKKDVEGAARQVAASIREAQNNALTGKRLGSGSIGACEFVWRTWDTTNYRIIQKETCGGSCAVTSCEYVLYSLSRGVTFRNEDANDAINYALFIYDVPFGNVNISSGNGTVPTNNVGNTSFTLRKGAYCADITVYSSGNVNEGSVYGC